MLSDGGVTTLNDTGVPVNFRDSTADAFFFHTISFPSQQVACVVLTNDDEACCTLRCRLKSLCLQG